MVTMYQDILTELSKETGMEQQRLSECPVETTAGMAVVGMREVKIQLCRSLVSSANAREHELCCSALWYYYSNIIIKEGILKLMFVKKVKGLIFSCLKFL